MMVLCALSASAQLLVDSLGNVGVRTNTSVAKSSLSINSVGDASYDVYVRSNRKNGMFINNVNEEYSDVSYGLRVFNTANCYNGTVVYGIHSEVKKAENNDLIANYLHGVYGKATTGVQNYGVFGYMPLNSGSDGAAICGSVYNGNCSSYITGQYAGLFDGKVWVNGDLYYSNGLYNIMPAPTNVLNTIYLADETTSTTSFNSPAANSILNKLSLVEAVKYNVKPMQPEVENPSATTMATTSTVTDSSQTLYGIDVQSLQAQFPSLVKTCNGDHVAIDYAGLIPLLLQSIKELQAKVAVLEAGNSNGGAVAYATAKPVGTTDMSSTNVEATLVASLSQNTPNPFSEVTTIAFTLPESIKEAMLCIYDMNGTQLEQIAIAERGASSVQIDGYKFSAGMYLYSLIADGTVIDTKRMVLTK